MTSAPQFTAGPLIVAANRNCASVEGFFVIERDLGDGSTSLPTAYVANEADANLYRSAPDMYEALSELVDLMQGVIDGSYKPDSFTLQPARAALPRATPPSSATGGE